MNLKKLLQFSIVIAATIASPLAHAENSKALINADYVRVREKPVKDAVQVGFLYKNMIVEVADQTPEKEQIGKESYYWYQVRSSEGSGWVYGKFLSPSLASTNIDTYDAPGDVQWLSNRFGDSTWYYNQNLTVQSFSLDEYRNLMRASENGNELAWSALRATILKHLIENPDDPSYVYLKKHLYSDAFLNNVLQYNFAYNDPEFFSLVPYSHATLLTAIHYSSAFLDGMPDEYWNDKDIVVAAMSSGAGCEEYIPRISGNLAHDPQVMAAIKRCQPHK